MKIEITERRNNTLLNRTDVYFTIDHPNEKTPARGVVRDELADLLNSKKDNVIVETIDTTFGIQKSNGYAKVYSSQKAAEELERKHILKRHKITAKKDKKEGEGKAEAEKEEAKQVEKKEEKPEKKADAEEGKE